MNKPVLSQKQKKQTPTTPTKRYQLIACLRFFGFIFYDKKEDVYLLSTLPDPHTVFILDKFSILSPIYKYGYRKLEEPIDLDIENFDDDWPSYIPDHLKTPPPGYYKMALQASKRS